MGLADLHIHTLHSWDGTSSVAAILKHVVDHTRLDVIAITDHNCITGALEALELAPFYGIEIIPGCEISTAQGHLLAYFINKPIPPGLSLIDTTLRVGESGGFCIVPHPTAKMNNSVHPQVIFDALKDPDVVRVLLGIEVYNAGIIHKRSNTNAQLLAETLPMAQVGNSDAHLLWMVGRGSTYFPGTTAIELCRAIQNRATSAVAGLVCNNVQIVSHWITRYCLRRLGWVSWNAGPQFPIKFGRPPIHELPDLIGNLSL